MAYLNPDKKLSIKIGGKTITINQKIIPDNTIATKKICSYIGKGDLVKPQKKVNDGSGKPRGITVHNTEAIKVSSDTTMAEQYARATWNENMGGAMVHYFVSGYNAIWQLLNTEVGTTERGWHASDGSTRRSAKSGAKWNEIGGNVDTIAIECIGNSAEAEDATALLVAHLCQKHGLNPKTDVYTHNYFMKQVEKIVSGAAKNCPIYILPHINDFYATVQKYCKTTTTSTSEISDELYRIRKTWNDVASQIGAYRVLENAKKQCKPGYKVFDSKGNVVYSINEKIDVIYQAYTQNKWWSEITNYNTTNGNGYAGVEKLGIQALKIRLSRGSIQYRVHTVNGKWWGWITDNTGVGANAYAGVLGQNIDAVQIKLIGDIADDYEVRYRVSTTSSSSYYNWIDGVSGSGVMAYAGSYGKPIDKIQIQIVNKTK